MQNQGMTQRHQKNVIN